MRIIQNTALMKRRLSCDGRPTLALRPGSSGSRMFHTQSDMSWRRWAGSCISVVTLTPHLGFACITTLTPFTLFDDRP